MDDLILDAGRVVVVLSVLILTCTCLIGGLWVTGVVGGELYRRLRRVYHYTVIKHWLARLENEGTHCFRKVGDEK